MTAPVKDHFLPLGNLPPHWRAMKLKYVATVQLSNVDKKSVEGEIPVRLCNYVDVYKNDFITSDMEFMEATATASQVVNFGLRAGDVLITKDSEDWQDIAVPALVVKDLPGVLCGYHLAHIRPKTDIVLGRFLLRAFVANGVADQFRLAANGITRYGVGKDELGVAWFPIPPVHEQRAIADFLDRKTAQIDALIAKKHRLIALLNERRQAVITHAVTKGLALNVSMKPSGLWWLPSIPQHWQVSRNGWLFRERDERGEPDLPLLIVSINKGVVLREFSDDKIERVAEDFGAYKVARKNDLAFNKMRFWQGAVGTSPVDGLVSPDYTVAEPSPGVITEYYQHLFRTVEYQTEINRYSHGLCADRNRLYWDEFKQMQSPVPPPDEQRAIVKFINENGARLKSTIETLEAHIERLQQYRQALISAAVTGQMAVPGVEGAVVVSKPAAKPNPYFRRTVLAAEIIDKLCAEPTFGHVKFQKCLFVAQHHLQLGDFEENYKRAAAGPYDNQMIRSVDSQLQKQKWFRVEQTGDRYTYKRMDRAGDHKKYFEGYFGDKADLLNSLIDLLKPLDTDRAEIVATLYAVWNDFLLMNETFDDDRIVQEVLTNWDESKKRFPEDRWKKALVWMREKGLVPTGFGKPTISGSTKGATGKK